MLGKSRRILILTTSYSPLIGGAELAVQYLTDHLPDFYFDLITSHPFKGLLREEKIGNVNVSRVGATTTGFDFLLPKVFLPISIFLKAQKLLRKNTYDFVYVLQASQAGGASWLLKKIGRVKVPVVINFQEGENLDAQPLILRLMRSLILRSADYYVVISSYLRDFILKQGIDSKRIHLMPNGVNQFVLNKEEALVFKNKLSLSGNRVVISVSRLVEKNGLADLLRGFAYVLKNYQEPVKLIIAGEGHLEQQLKAQAQDLGISESVLFVGAIDNKEVPLYLSLADVFVRPSLSEGLGISFLEAMGVGVPIIATPVGGIPDFLIDTKTGLFCRVGDSENIGTKIISLLSNETLRQEIISNSKALIKESYTWDVMANKFRIFCDTITSA